MADCVRIGIRQAAGGERLRQQSRTDGRASGDPRKQGLVGAPIEILANYRGDLSGKDSWKVGGTRFFVVTVTKGEAQAGAVFEAADGRRFILRPATTRHQADALVAAAGPGTTVFAIRPYWGMPAKEWIAADPEFWKPNPMTRSK